MRKRTIFLTSVLALMLGVAPVSAQRKPAPAAKKPAASIKDKLSEARAEVIARANEYKASLEKLLALQEAEARTAEEQAGNFQRLFDQQIIARVELERARKAAAEARTRAEETRKEMGAADTLIAEVRAEEQEDRMPALPAGGYRATSALIRYNGPAAWMLADVSRVQTFFAGRFGRTLPISALGQTATHNRMNFDHSNSVDVALHPDSAEGQALMAYLRSQGIPFLAFRGAVPGAATGAHIHIGYPSRRIR